MNLKDLGLRELEVETRPIKLKSGVEVSVRTYLPIDDKADLIAWVINLAVDDKTGCISPVRFETCFSVAVVQRYAGIEIDAEETLGNVYDLLEYNDVIDQVMGAIPENELRFLSDLAKETAQDVARYNNSFLGMVNMVSGDAESLQEQTNSLINKIKNSEGLEQLAAIRDVVGTD